MGNETSFIGAVKLTLREDGEGPRDTALGGVSAGLRDKGLRKVPIGSRDRDLREMPVILLCVNGVTAV